MTSPSNVVSQRWLEVGYSADPALREFGCAFGQGFLLAKPMPVADLRDLFAAGERVKTA